jgi:hypothetical protein
MAGLHEHRGVTVIEVGGEIDVFTCRLLRELLLSILSRQQHLVVVNMDKTVFVDAAGLGVLCGHGIGWTASGEHSPWPACHPASDRQSQKPRTHILTRPGRVCAPIDKPQIIPGGSTLGINPGANDRSAIEVMATRIPSKRGTARAHRSNQ